MTRIEFFFNVDDKLQKIAEISEKAIVKNVKLMLLVQSADLATQVKEYLWSKDLAFLPHHAPEDVLASETPIVVDWEGKHFLHDEVLINLQHPHPIFFSRFRKLIEIVGIDEADKAQARIRYKFYRDRGYEIRSYDANTKEI